MFEIESGSLDCDNLDDYISSTQVEYERGAKPIVRRIIQQELNIYVMMMDWQLRKNIKDQDDQALQKKHLEQMIHVTPGHVRYGLVVILHQECRSTRSNKYNQYSFCTVYNNGFYLSMHLTFGGFYLEAPHFRWKTARLLKFCER